MGSMPNKLVVMRTFVAAISTLVPTMTLSLLSVTATGCGGKKDQPQAISAGAFYQPAVGEEGNPPVPGAGDGQGAAGAEPTIELPGNGDLSESLTDKLLAVPPTPTTLPSATGRVVGGGATGGPGQAQGDAIPSATVRQVTPTGTYMTLGGMLAEVNGTPIFASKVVRTLEPVLAAKAKELSPGPFETEARRLLDKQINEYVQNELLYAAAVRNLEPDDRKIADAVTTEWRERRIRESGGSLEQAKRAATQNGDNFDDLVTEQNRDFLVKLFREKKINPRISVTTADMRRYYRENVQRKFTQRTQATFRMIRVDPARNGGKDAALAKIREAEARIKGGESFAKVAGEVNDDAGLRRRGGEIGAPVDKGSFALESVEAAVFRTDEGALTGIVEDNGGFYLAQVTTKTIGTVKTFDDPEVQNAVRTDLYIQQQLSVQDQYIAELEKGAVINRDPRMLQTAIEMVNQRYAAWRRN